MGAGQSISIGLSYFLSFMALVSISLGILNFLPIPVLDGGHLFFYLIEAITGKKVEFVYGIFTHRIYENLLKSCHPFGTASSNKLSASR